MCVCVPLTHCIRKLTVGTPHQHAPLVFLIVAVGTVCYKKTKPIITFHVSLFFIIIQSFFTLPSLTTSHFALFYRVSGQAQSSICRDESEMRLDEIREKLIREVGVTTVTIFSPPSLPQHSRTTSCFGVKSQWLTNQLHLDKK